jgi:hypothetical protein
MVRPVPPPVCRRLGVIVEVYGGGGGRRRWWPCRKYFPVKGLITDWRCRVPNEVDEGGKIKKEKPKNQRNDRYYIY